MAKIFIQRVANTGAVRVSVSKKLKPYLNNTLLSFNSIHVSAENAHDRVAHYIESIFESDSKIEFYDEAFGIDNMVTVSKYVAKKALFMEALTEIKEDSWM